MALGSESCLCRPWLVPKLGGTPNKARSADSKCAGRRPVTLRAGWDRGRQGETSVVSGVRGGEAAGTPALQLLCSGSKEEIVAGTCAAKAPARALRFPDGGCRRPSSSR